MSSKTGSRSLKIGGRCRRRDDLLVAKVGVGGTMPSESTQLIDSTLPRMPSSPFHAVHRYTQLHTTGLVMWVPTK
jgi:hypothetical protein